jgi:hypothetical protein
VDLPRPSARLVALLLAVAVAVGLIGLLLRGVAYLLVIVAVGLAIYAAAAWMRRDHAD